jgi:hypothetical protein
MAGVGPGGSAGSPAIPLPDEIETAKGSRGRPVLRAPKRGTMARAVLCLGKESQIGLMA